MKKALVDIAKIISTSAVPLCAVMVLPAYAARPATNSIACVEDADGLAAARYDAKIGTTYVLRPDSACLRPLASHGRKKNRMRPQRRNG